MHYEIERKYLLEKLPEDLKYTSQRSIRQGYLSADKKREVRLRQEGRYYYQTVKTGSGLERREWETRLSQKQFAQLWPGTEGYRLEKIRYQAVWQGYTLEIDVYKDHLKGLITGEVEFHIKADAISFEQPAFFGEEVTFDDRYRNRKLCRVKKSELKTLLPSQMDEGVVGTIPYLREKGKIKVVLITRRSNGHWIFPKGQQERKRSHLQVALMEAQEEAGIVGTVTHLPIRVAYKKGDTHINMLAFPIEVSKLKKNWDERAERDRKIVSLKDAYNMTDQPAVHSGLRFLEQMLV